MTELQDREESVSEEEINTDQDQYDWDNRPKVPLTVDPGLVEPDKGKYKYGVLYLSYVPEGLNVKLVKEIMSQYGGVGRVYLEPEKNNKKYRTYTEGWVEFLKKKEAKMVAETLNGCPLQFGRKRCKANGQIWSIKYLHKFKWANLIDQLAHDKAVREQKRKFEMSQAKKQIDFYQKMTEKSNRLKKGEAYKDESDGAETDKVTSRRRKLLKKKQKKTTNRGDEFDVSVDDDLLGSIFKRVT